MLFSLSGVWGEGGPPEAKLSQRSFGPAFPFLILYFELG